LARPNFTKEATLSTKSLPWQVKAAAIVLFVETLALLSGAGYFVFAIVTDEARLLSTLIALGGFTLLAAVWVLSLAVGLLQGKKSSRTPAMFAQMIPFSIGIGSTGGPNSNALVAAVLLAVALFVVGLLLSKPVASLMNRSL
jgi:hypothetical protein